MQTVVALLLFASLAGVSWWVYLRTGARRWTVERDPLGEPPVRMAALIGAIVVALAFVSSGGGGSEHTSSMQQGLGDGDDPGLLSAPRAMVAATVPLTKGRDGEAPEAEARGEVPDAKNPDSEGREPDEPAAPATAADARPDTQTSPSPLPAYGRLVVRARKAAERRGASITWYPTVVRQAASASRQRSR